MSFSLKIGNNDSKTKIGIFNIIGVLLSLYSFYNAAVMLLNRDVFTFLILVLAGLIILPFGWKQIESKLSFTISVPLRIIAWIILIVIATYASL